MNNHQQHQKQHYHPHHFGTMIPHDRKDAKKTRMAVNIFMALLIVAALATTAWHLFTSDGFKRGYKPIVVPPSVQASIDAEEKQKGLLASGSDYTQPMASKISDGGDLVVPEILDISRTETGAMYTLFWEAFAYQAASYADTDKDGTLSPAELEVAKKDFLSSLGYVMDESGVVYVEGTKTVVSPDTLTCYFNGIVPGRGYIKPNCPIN